MAKLSLGETHEEKKSTYEALMTNAEKWGRVCRVIGLVMAIFMSLMLLTAASDGFILGLIFGAVSIVVTPVFAYWYGHILFYGYIFIRAFFEERSIGTAEVAGAVGTSFVVSYFLGGRKAAKTMGMIWVVIVIASVVIGVYAGLYYFIKFWKETYDLGIEKDFKTRFLESVPFLNKQLNKA